MKRLHWILLLMILLIPTESISAKKKTEKSDREIWCDGYRRSLDVYFKCWQRS